MNGGGGWGDRNTGRTAPGHHGIAGSGASRRARHGGRFFALTRSWVTGALVYLAAGFVTSRVLVGLLGTEARLETFGWRLALLHLPTLTVTLLTVLASARILPDEYRASSRTLYPLAALAVPLAGLLYGFAVAGDVVGIEGVLMPGVSLAAGAASGVAVDRLLEERATRTPEPPRYAYDWRDGGATATEYLGLVVLVTLLIGAMAMAGVGGKIGERLRCAISSLAGGGGSCPAGGQAPEAKPRTDADYEPKMCQISSISDTAGGKVRIGWFEWGEEYGFQQKVSQASTDVNGDGTVDGQDKVVSMTFTDAASAGGAITVTRDQRTGKIVRIDMTQTVESGSASGKVEVGGDNGESGQEKRGGKGSASDSSGDTGIDVVTNSIVFGKDADADTEADRGIAEQWLDGSGNNTAPFAYLFGDHGMENRPEGNDPFQRLMFEDGLSSSMRYTGESDAQEFGFEISLGMSLGFSLSTEAKKETLGDARFLGAPQGDARTYLPYSYCAN
ncbi:hypothetical protein [Streptomyces sp. NPDC088180]|uniref:hypothetical protein n=1 Tax=Streptomyces sp. NPDC088180 TaxID=3365837 RepID=UPI0038275988